MPGIRTASTGAPALSSRAALSYDTAFESRVGGSAKLVDAEDLAYRLERNVKYAGVACMR